MSSENNHQLVINLTNYEDFFILYMDGELNDVQAAMVENFLVVHPHLQTEMDLLMNTKLPVEDLGFDKTLLLSQNMQAQTLQEELLLFIDDELPADKKKLVELEIASNVSYQKQLQLLTAAKLDAAEKVLHPYRKELYRHTKRVLVLQPWMRIAAALLLVASMAIIYLVQQGKTSVVGTAGVKTLPEKPMVLNPNEDQVRKEMILTQQVVANEPAVAVKKEKTIVTPLIEDKMKSNNPAVAMREEPTNLNDVAVLPKGERQNTINYSSDNNYTKPQLQHAQINSTSVVTSAGSDAYNPVTASVTSAVFTETDNNRKGSLKSFLRKAGRTITRTAGLSSEDGDDETLIGVVAVKLK